MGCGASKIQQEETGQTYQPPTRRNDDILKKDDETEAPPRKSVSSVASEGGFLKRVIASNNEKEREGERDLEHASDGGGRRSFSSYNSRLKEYTWCFKQPDQFPETLDKPAQIHNKNKDKTEEEFSRQSDVEDNSSILVGAGSPSFREYCVPNDQYAEVAEDEEGEETTSGKEGENKVIEGQVEKRGRRGRGIRRALGLRGVLVPIQRRGSVKITPPKSSPSTQHFIPKPAG